MMYGGEGGKIGQDDAYEDDDHGEACIPKHVGVVEEVEAVERLVEDACGDSQNNAGNDGSEESVPDAAREERAGDEAAFGTYKLHGFDCLALSVEGDTDGAAYEQDADKQQDGHEDDEEPGGFMEHLVELVDHALLVGHTGYIGKAVDIGIEAGDALVASIKGRTGENVGMKIHHHGRIQWIVADKTDKVFIEIFGKNIGGLLAGDIIDMLDVGDGLNLFFEQLSIGIGDVGGEVDLKGDTLLHVAGHAIGMVFHHQTQPEQEKHQGDA